MAAIDTSAIMLSDEANELMQGVEPPMNTFPLLRMDIGREGNTASPAPFPKSGKAGRDGKVKSATLPPSAQAVSLGGEAGGIERNW